MAKQLKDGRIDFSEELTSEHISLMQSWYAGQGCPLYALQSSGTLEREYLCSASVTLSKLTRSMESEEIDTANELINLIEAAMTQFPIED